MFSKKKIKQNQIIIVAAIAILLIPLLSITLQTILLSPFSYAKSVPIQFGYNERGDYWMISAVVSETTNFKMVLESESTETIDTDTKVKSGSEVGLLIEPYQPYSETNLYTTDIKYIEHGGHDPSAKAPVYDINDAGWLTTAIYHLSLWKNGFQETEQTVRVNYKEPKIVEIQTGEGTVTVNNLGILPQGVEVPSGDLVLVYDPDGNQHIFPKADLLHMIDKFNEWAELQFPSPWGPFYKWKDVWNWCEKEGLLPQDVQMVHVSDFLVTNNKQIKLTYGGIVFAGTISVYIPADLADTVVIQLFIPNPKIVDVDPDSLPDIDEGESTVFYVKVENTGTEGTVSIAVSSDYYSISPLTETTRNMDANEVFTFKFEAIALSVGKDTDTTLNILVQGRGGIDTYELKGKILDVAGYDPSVPPPTETILIVNVVDSNYEGIPEIVVSINYGASTDTQITNVEGTTQFELGKYSGDVKIITQETAMYPSKTEIIKVQYGTNEHTIVLGVVIPWMLIITILIVVIAIAIAIYMAKRRR